MMAIVVATAGLPSAQSSARNPAIGEARDLSGPARPDDYQHVQKAGKHRREAGL
jgi:hypothetical protein